MKIVKYSDHPNAVLFTECYWCDDTQYTEVGRFLHLWNEHPEFFEEYDEINGWGIWPFSSHNIPDKPEGDNARDSDL